MLDTFIVIVFGILLTIGCGIMVHIVYGCFQFIEECNANPVDKVFMDEYRLAQAERLQKYNQSVE